jgi:hypothetical protein
VGGAAGRETMAPRGHQRYLSVRWKWSSTCQNESQPGSQDSGHEYSNPSDAHPYLAINVLVRGLLGRPRIALGHA